MSEGRVVVVTGGGGGIGAAIATELGRRGHLVVTMDPLVTVDGTEAAAAPAPEETTAGRIVAAGGQARASAVSVTDRDAVRELFASIVAEEGRLDGVVNVAGFSRPTTFTTGEEDDWRAVLSVHLDGYRNVLEAALPLMAAAGYGRIVGVTSGSGWRPADTGAYGCAKRAVAALTWELGRCAPPGVTVNAISPIALTRMVTAAIERARAAAATGGGGSASSGATRSGSTRSGGLALGAMPAPEELGPISAHLAADGPEWCNGRVVFVGGSEIAVVDRPRPIEVVRTDGSAPLAPVLEAATAKVLGPAEAGQVSTGGSNGRLGPIFDADPADGDAVAERSPVRSCLVVSDRPEVAKAIEAALADRSISCRTVDTGASTFVDAADALTRASATGPIDAVVLAASASEGSAPASVPAPSSGGARWAQLLDEHDGIVEDLLAHAAWSRAVADLASSERPIRLVTVTDARAAGGRVRAQAVAQHARSARGATKELVLAYAVADEGGDPTATGEVVAHLLGGAGTDALAAAELAVAPGQLVLRGHPRPRGSITFGGPELPPWFDDALRALLEDA